MLPAGRTQPFHLADVLPNCLAALGGTRGSMGLRPVSHAVVVLVDGLGLEALQLRSGHARVLARRLGEDAPIDAGFPTTTASALASLATGVRPGRHGMVGYTALDPEHDRVVNGLSGWEDDGLDPATWQRMPTLFEQAEPAAVAIGPERFRNTGFTRAVLRGAEYRGGRRIADRVRRALESLREPGPRLVYLYVPELDVVAHRSGVASLEWTAALEELDEAMGELVRGLGPEHGLLVTADHGIVDVDRADHRIVPPELLAGVRHVAGEPRGLQLHLEADARAEDVVRAWQQSEGSAAWVVAQEEAIAADWLGPVDDPVRPRIGDVLVLAQEPVAYYLDADASGRKMVGQHGSLSAAERTVPLLRFGAFAS